MEPGPLVTREEVEAYLLRVYDMAAAVDAICELSEEANGGEEEEAE
jgi:hypothetical protein